MTKSAISLLFLITIVFLTQSAERSRSHRTCTTCGVEKAFQLAKQSDPELISFIRTMPKGGDLHNHLSGATYAEYLLLSAKQQGLGYNVESRKFVSNSNLSSSGSISVDSLIRNTVLCSQFFDTYSMRGWYPNTTNGHDLFFNTFNYMGTANRLQPEMLAEVISRNIYQNVQHLEIMTSCVPRSVVNAYLTAVSDSLFEVIERAPVDSTAFFLAKAFTFLKPLLIREDLNRKIQDYTVDSIFIPTKKILSELYGITNPDSLISVKFIYQLSRNNTLKNVFCNAILAAQASRINNDIAALNMVQAEDDVRSLTHFDKQMEILHFLYTTFPARNCALHAGELVLNGSPVEPMRNRIAKSITRGHAQRIGHGISVAWEDSLPSLLDLMAKKTVAVEICLSSNESILGVAGRMHPISLYIGAGVPITINTDDEGVSRSNLTMEYLKAVQRYNLSYEKLKEIVRNSLEYSFLSGESLFHDHNYLKKKKDPHTLKGNSEKMRRQIALEEAFEKFETQFRPVKRLK